MVIEGDSFHTFMCAEMYQHIKFTDLFGHCMTHISLKGNLLDRLEQLFCEYGETGIGHKRLNLHSEEAAAVHPGLSRGEFTSSDLIPPAKDLLFYEGLHGGLITESFNIAQHVDFIIGVAPITNLEWIQKANCDSAECGYSHTDVGSTPLYVARPMMFLVFRLNSLLQMSIFNMYLSLIQLIFLMCDRYQDYIKV